MDHDHFTVVQFSNSDGRGVLVWYWPKWNDNGGASMSYQLFWL